MSDRPCNSIVSGGSRPAVAITTLPHAVEFKSSPVVTTIAPWAVTVGLMAAREASFRFSTLLWFQPGLGLINLHIITLNIMCFFVNEDVERQKLKKSYLLTMYSPCPGHTQLDSFCTPGTCSMCP